jgi:hypothetical protein
MASGQYRHDFRTSGFNPRRRKRPLQWRHIALAPTMPVVVGVLSSEQPSAHNSPLGAHGPPLSKTRRTPRRKGDTGRTIGNNDEPSCRQSHSPESEKFCEEARVARNAAGNVLLSTDASLVVLRVATPAVPAVRIIGGRLQADQ